MLTGLTKKVLEASLEAELSEHLGYDKHAPSETGCPSVQQVFAEPLLEGGDRLGAEHDVVLELRFVADQPAGQVQGGDGLVVGVGDHVGV